jgi:hypothetical protein
MDEWEFHEELHAGAEDDWIAPVEYPSLIAMRQRIARCKHYVRLRVFAEDTLDIPSAFPVESDEYTVYEFRLVA